MTRLHLPAIPHTITSSRYSHCAFTGKVLRFAPMMRSRGYQVYHYGVEGSEAGADVNIDILTKEEWQQLRVDSYLHLHHEAGAKDLEDERRFVGDLANVSTPIYREFNKRLRAALLERYQPGDIVCLPFGEAHKEAIAGLEVLAVETGIGYPDSFLPFRICESYAWKHWTCGRCDAAPHNYWFVCPNYYDILEWPVGQPSPIVGYFGRICPIKGLDTVLEVARRFPGTQFVICGQGEDLYSDKADNLSYQPPLHGADRGAFLGSLACLLAPSVYLEPFCGVNVEAQLCGTPVIAPDAGAFAETVEHEKTGLLCHTLADFCSGVQRALRGGFDRDYIRKRAQDRYDMYQVAKQNDYAFRCIGDLRSEGWYAEKSHLSQKL